MIDCLVTGANGFIGKKLVKALQKKKEKVIGLTSNDLDITNLNSWEKLPKAKIL